MQITKNIEKKNPLTLEELKQLMDKMVEARSVMLEAGEDLDARKDAYKELCKSQNAVIDDCFADYERGFSVEVIPCTVSYDGNVASYYSVETGEKVEGLPIEENEQLVMTGGKRVDAEVIIREASKNEG